MIRARSAALGEVARPTRSLPRASHREDRAPLTRISTKRTPTVKGNITNTERFKYGHDVYFIFSSTEWDKGSGIQAGRQTDIHIHTQREGRGGEEQGKEEREKKSDTRRKRVVQRTSQVWNSMVSFLGARVPDSAVLLERSCRSRPIDPADAVSCLHLSTYSLTDAPSDHSSPGPFEEERE